jgi:hypothetical protein
MQRQSLVGPEQHHTQPVPQVPISNLDFNLPFNHKPQINTIFWSENPSTNCRDTSPKFPNGKLTVKVIGDFHFEMLH